MMFFYLATIQSAVWTQIASIDLKVWIGELQLGFVSAVGPSRGKCW